MFIESHNVAPFCLSMEHFAPCAIRTKRFEVDQYVRVQLSNGRSEIGVVVSLDEVNDTAVIATRHGYDVTVRLDSVHRAFLLVLDLNGVLVARGRGSFADRPGVEEFVRFVMNNFVVAVWTSGLERTSIPIIDKVLNGYQDRLLFQLYRDSCGARPTPDKPYHTVKNLQRIFDSYPKSFNAVNTIIVDDSPDKCSHPDIALCPESFNDPERQANDRGLEMAMEVLKEVLRTDSHEPLIRAAQERLLAIAKRKEEAKEKQLNEGAKLSDVTDHMKGAAYNNTNANTNGNGSGNGNDDDDNNNNNRNRNRNDDRSNSRKRNEGNNAKKDRSEHRSSDRREEPDTDAAAMKPSETFFWETRLCCENISVGCTRDACRFSHDPDDGKRPCSRKDKCRRGHANRWSTPVMGQKQKEKYQKVAIVRSSKSPQQATKAARCTAVRGGGGMLDVLGLPEDVPLFSTHPDLQKGPDSRHPAVEPQLTASEELRQLIGLQSQQWKRPASGTVAQKPSGALHFKSDGGNGVSLLRQLQATVEAVSGGSEKANRRKHRNR